MSYQGPPPPPQEFPPPQGEPGGSYQSGPYQSGPSGPYQSGPSGPYQSSPGGYPGGPIQGAAPDPSAYSDWLHRVGAYIVDGLPIFVLYLIASFTFRFFIGYVFLLAAFGWLIYNRWYMGGQGQSLGKRTLAMKLLSEETGQPIGTLNAFLRDICHIVDSVICYVGYLFPLWDAKRQTLADKIMKTVVVPA